LLESWAFATSPYGLGLTSEQSWALTPREFQALEGVYLKHLERWGIERAQFANAHFRKNDGTLFDIDDFVSIPGRGERRAAAQRVRRESNQRMLREALVARQRRLMAAHQFPEEDLPVWARMTDEEKRERGLK